MYDDIDEKYRHPIMVADPMTLWQNYHLARSISDALSALSNAPANSRIIAGGTDLLLDIQQGRHLHINTLVDVTEIPEMTAIDIREGEIFIGAAVPHNKITTSPIIKEHCHALAVASGLIGGLQVRNAGTIGGNVAHALPAADGTIALLALGAQAEIASPSGQRRVPLTDLFLGPGKSVLEQKVEVLTGFYVGLRDTGQASAFKRIMRPQGVAIAILNLAVWLYRVGERIEDVRIAVGPSGPIPRRMIEAENVLRGKIFSPELINQAYVALLGEANFRTSRYRATKDYRQKMVGVLLEDTLIDAFQLSSLSEI
jgi:carbon-monoxide dehydrogenase medium subunit